MRESSLGELELLDDIEGVVGPFALLDVRDETSLRAREDEADAAWIHDESSMTLRA